MSFLLSINAFAPIATAILLGMSSKLQFTLQKLPHFPDIETHQHSNSLSVSKDLNPSSKLLLFEGFSTILV